MTKIEYFSHQRKKCTSASNPLHELTVKAAVNIGRYHRTFTQYSPTPLAELKELSGYLGLKGFYVKDESYRFGLKAFKVLGGSYAIGMELIEKLGLNPDIVNEASWQQTIAREFGKKFTFITATDGNHGRSIAWASHYFGQKAVVYMPKGSSPRRAENIRSASADVIVTDGDFDATVRIALDKVDGISKLFAQDMDFRNHYKFPLQCMQGYMTMPFEAVTALTKQSVLPTHIFIQAGAGLLGAAVSGFTTNYYGDKCPRIIIVESDACSCLLSSAKAGTETTVCVPLKYGTIMAGLSAGCPCSLAWKVIRQCGDGFIACTDDTSANGMRILGNPLHNDPKVISGESGAVCIGLVHALMKDPNLNKVKDEIGLNKESTVLCFSSEGDTDEESYRRIVWSGAYASL
ncbi:MAG: diaminopropionate ammonia-lyase [Candidatus Pelethousia sp.]|nr:diaminopropionate ammonia-lyase [Candidatus Pelethousia sp.]